MSVLHTVFYVVCGLYIGKYYPQYVPIPKVNKENIDRLLHYIKEIERDL